MKIEYSSIYWFKFSNEEQDDRNFYSLKKSKEIEHLPLTFASSKMNNFVENIILKVPNDNVIPRGASLFDNKGKLHGMSITFGREKVAKDMVHGLLKSELELFILTSQIFYPLKRSRDTNYYLSDLEKMLRETKDISGGSRSDVRKLRLMEKSVQVMAEQKSRS